MNKYNGKNEKNRILIGQPTTSHEPRANKSISECLYSALDDNADLDLISTSSSSEDLLECTSKISSLKIPQIVNVKIPETYETRCRICLKTTSSNISLKQPLSGRRAATFNDIFSELTGFKVVYTQNFYPTSICFECKSVLQCFDTFLATCKQTEKILEVVYTCENSEEANNVLIKTKNTVYFSSKDKDEDFGWNENQVENSDIYVESQKVFRYDLSNIDLSLSKDLQSQLKELEQMVKPYVQQDLQLKSSRFLDQRERRQLNRIYNRVICHICGKIVCSETFLKKHLQMHAKTELVVEPKIYKPRDNDIASKTLACEHCDQMYKTIAGLRDHKKIEHPKDGKRPVFACNCGKTFSSYASRRYHVKMVHLDERKYRCGYCAKRFFTPSTLKTHMAVHMNAEKGRPYKCDLCDQRFVARYKLKAHIENKHLCKQ